MSLREHKIDRIWNSWQTMLALLLVGTILAIWSNWRLPLPGVSIAILGGMAAVMSLRPQMRIWEKAWWMVLIGALLFAEIHSIRADRKASNDEQTQTRNEENAKFNNIAQGLKDAYAQNQQQFSATIDESNRLMSLSQNSLNNITGGDAWACVYPSHLIIGTNSLQMAIKNMGNYILSGVKVSIWRDTDAPCGQATNPSTQELDVGVLYAQQIRLLKLQVTPNPERTCVTSQELMDSYEIQIDAPNGMITESLLIRPTGTPILWGYHMNVFRQKLVMVHGNQEYQAQLLHSSKGWSDAPPSKR